MLAVVSAQSNTVQLVLSTIAAILAATIVGLFASGRKWVRNDLVNPVQRLVSKFGKHVKDDKKFQRKILARMDAYELKAETERQAQITERTRVQA